MWNRIKAWWKRRKYTTEMQLEHLRTLVFTDDRWMSHSPIVSALTARYRAALRPDWYETTFEGVEALRRRLGLLPEMAEDEAKKAVAEVRVLTAETAHAVHAALAKALATAENEIEKSKLAAAIREVEEKHPESAA